MRLISGIIFFYLSLFFAGSTQATEEVCFTNGDQFEQIKMILPAHFQNPPLVFTRNVRDSVIPVTAAVKILITDEKTMGLVSRLNKPASEADIVELRKFVKSLYPSAKK